MVPLPIQSLQSIKADLPPEGIAAGLIQIDIVESFLFLVEQQLEMLDLIEENFISLGLGSVYKGQLLAWA